MSSRITKIANFKNAPVPQIARRITPVQKTKHDVVIFGATKNKGLSGVNSPFKVNLMKTNVSNVRSIMNVLSTRLERYCKAITPVKSGTLKRSLKPKIDEFLVTGNGTNAEWAISISIESEDPKAKYKIHATQASPGRYIPILNKRLTVGKSRDVKNEVNVKGGFNNKIRRKRGHNINIGMHPGTKEIPYGIRVRHALSNNIIRTDDIASEVGSNIVREVLESFKTSARFR